MLPVGKTEYMSNLKAGVNRAFIRLSAFPLIVTPDDTILNGPITAVATTIPISSGAPTANDIYENKRTGERLYVVSFTTPNMVVVRGIDGTKAQAMLDLDVITKITIGVRVNNALGIGINETTIITDINTNIDLDDSKELCFRMGRDLGVQETLYLESITQE